MYSVGQLLWSLALSQIFPAAFAELSIPEQKPITDANSVLTTNPIYSKQATCESDSGKIYITSEGSAYKLQCSYSAPGVRKIGDSTVESSFTLCMEKCSTNSWCQSIQYNARPAGGPVPSEGDCILFREDVDATTSNPQYDFAVRVDPPTHDQDDVPSKICTTACPFADGMLFSSSYGENFKMHCGMRHGTAYLTTVEAKDFQECIDSCAALIACHSVDYQARTRKCYLGSHHGNPTIIASSFNSAHSIGCAGACCEGYAREPGSEPDTSCGNEGLAFAIYANQKNGQNVVYVPPNNGNFDPVVMKNTQPYYTGSTTSLGVANSASIYGQAPRDPQFVVTNHRGYLYAHQGGEYTFSSPTTDDSSLLWVNSNAYSGWTRQNANLDQAYVSTGVVPQEYKVTLEKGKYYPVRLMWANTGGPGNFVFKITAPDGTVVIDDKTTTCPYLVKYGCRDEYNAPEYAAWGSES